MAELLLELYSEEIPPQLQIAARSQIKQFIENSFKENNIKYNNLLVYSSPEPFSCFGRLQPAHMRLQRACNKQDAGQHFSSSLIGDSHLARCRAR